MGAASPFEMGRMSQGALDRVNQAFNSSLFHPGSSGHEMSHGGGFAPIGRASIDWYAGMASAAAPPLIGGARIGRSSFDEDRFRQASLGSAGGPPIGGGLPPSLIGSGAGPLIGGMPAQLAGSALGAHGAPLVGGGPLLPGMALSANPLALGVGQIPLPVKPSQPYPAAPISAGEAAAVDFGSALYNRPGGLDAGVLRRSSSLEAGVIGSGMGQGLASLEHLQGGLAPGLAIPQSVFSASTGSESGSRAPCEAGHTYTGSYASSAGARGEPAPPLGHMGSVAEDSVFRSGDAPRLIKARRARRGELQTALRGDSANMEQVEVLSHAESLRSDGSRGRRTSAKVRVVCSSGGHFSRQASGNLEYEGGETRLVSVANFCSLADLQEALERVAAARQGAGGAAGADILSGSSTDSTLVPHLKYQLPSEPHMYVDLVDDEDVQLMFDEWADFAASNRGSSYKLHIFIEWSRPGAALPSAETSPHTAKAAAAAAAAAAGGSREAEKISGNSIRTHQSSGEELARAGRAGSGDVASPSVAGAAGGEGEKAGGSGRGEMSQQAMYQGMAGRMEIISPGDVTLVKFLGSGGYGEVYLGKWHSSEVAVKCLNPSLFFVAGDPNSNVAILDLLREADLLGSLRHPNVVWVYGIVLPRLDDEGMSVEENRRQGSNTLRPPAMVTEFMSQGSLKTALARKADVVQGAMHRLCIAMDAAKGMAYLHAKNIVHFDLKSANLLLGYRDRRAICKVADFGLSKQKRDTYVSNVTSQRGTLPWIAPEIIKTPESVTERVDVYSFGVVLWELWTGREPYEGLNYHALLHQITTSNGALRPPLPGKARWDGESPPEPAPGWSDLCERCWGEDPAARPDFEEIVCVLKGMAAALRPPRTRRPAPPPMSASSAASSEICAAAVLAQSTHGERIGAAPRPASPPPASFAAVAAAAQAPQPYGGGPFAGLRCLNRGVVGGLVLD
ncbi:hypothetical protein WJX81_003108 [Elliptochloris bilobata]|uniref:Protein kinase domain-containing protein n=1 Tax=Elliptochloris bilobata TaxID=381761 RepID=A0AAW1RQ80_9CHLO